MRTASSSTVRRYPAHQRDLECLKSAARDPPAPLVSAARGGGAVEAVAAALLVHPCPWVAAEPARWMARLLAHCGAASRGAAWGWPRLPPPCDAYSSLEGPGSHLEDRVRIPLPLKHLCTTGHRITGGHRQCLAVQCAILITCHRTTHHRRPAVEPPREVVHPTACSPLRSPAGLLSRDLGTWWMLTTHFQTMSDTLALCFISYQNIKLFRERRR